jgi:hypothetical protein
MTDYTSNAPVERAHKAPRTEFYVYFAIIFVAALPLAALAWALGAARRRSFAGKGPVARAWSQARIITPMIFSA